ncbi:MAG TPA: cytochrome c biogenesis protein CcsA [Polyangiaceae bacterium]
MQRSGLIFHLLLALTSALVFYLIYFIFLHTPTAQPESGGFAQKIFYFHVPSAYAMYLSGVVCFAASAAFLVRPTDARNAWAQAGAECAVLFSLLVLTSGPLWAKKAWGVYWTWDPRLTTLLLSALIYAAIVVVRTFVGDGEPERRFVAAIGVLGTVNLPIIHYSVQKWGGNHPTVITGRGGGLRSVEMREALWLGFATMTLLTIMLLWARARSAWLRSRVDSLEERMLDAGLEL